MDVWKNTRKLKIFYEEEHSGTDKVTYRLYEPNFATAMKFIFQSILDQNSEREEEKYQACCNILSFIGKRGAGKTTAMMEFCRILKKMKEDEYRDWWIQNVITSKEDQKILASEKFTFHVLPSIDASLLGASDDLLEIILDGIYQEYEKFCQGAGGRGAYYNGSAIHINELFEELLALYHSSSDNRKRDWEEDYTVGTVKGLLHSNSFVKQRIGILLDELVKLDPSHAGREYFVIVIDDLDLNISHAYRMLEQLQKFFTDPRILILITMDYEQMCRICAEYFHHEMEATDKNDMEIGNELHSSQLANDFMTKIFPLQQRLFLPDMKKQGRRMRIQLGEGEYISIKRLMMEKVADRMRIFYDAKGDKRHFCEPDTVRKLVDYNNFLNSLIPIDYGRLIPVEQLNAMRDSLKKEEEKKENKRILREYDQNHNRFNWDIMERQAQLTLTAMHRSVFRQLLEFPLERRMMYFISSEKNPDTGMIRLVDVSKEKREAYRYGDLLEKIYTWGRFAYEDKPFISCVIASFTSEMVREYVNFRYLPDAERRGWSLKRLKAFLGVSFSNEWVMQGIFPSEIVNINRISRDIRVGYEKEAQSITMFFEMSNLTTKKSGKNKGVVNDLHSWLEKTGIIETLECMDMFLSSGMDADYSGPEMEFELQEGSPWMIMVKMRGGCVLDLMGFVGKSLDYAGQRNRIRDMLSKGLNCMFEQYMKSMGLPYDSERMMPEIEKEISKMSVFSRYWDEELSAETALPFYDLDLMYNVVKRIRNRQKEKVTRESFFKSLLDLYQSIEDALKNQEESYQYVKMGYRDIFRACPYIQALRDFPTRENSEIVNKITEALYWSFDFNAVTTSEPEEPKD